MKTKISIILSMALTISLFAGCGGGTQASDNTAASSSVVAEVASEKTSTLFWMRQISKI